MRVMVTGATGDVGGPLVGRLLRAGCRVRALCRRPEAALPAGVERATGDVTDAAAVAAAVAGVDAVVHAAAHLGAGPRALHARVNAGGTRIVLEAARAAGVARVVHLSTVAVHGRRDGGEARLDPSAPFDPAPALRDDYAWSKIEAERWVRCVAGETGLPVAVLRPGIVWGGRRRFLARVARRAPRGTLVVAGSPSMRLPMVHADDVAEAVWRALAAPALPPGPLFVVGPDEPTQAAWLEALPADVRPARCVFLPLGGLLRQAAGRFAPARARAVAYRLAWALQSVRYDTAATADALGWRPTIGIDAGAAATAPAGAVPALALADEG